MVRPGPRRTVFARDQGWLEAFNLPTYRVRQVRRSCISPSVDGASMNTLSGNYPIQHRVGEIERLNIQSSAMMPETVAMLEQLGSIAGWVCLDIGCGPRGITDLLSARVGSAGRVIGLDMNAQFLDHARENAPNNVEFRLGNAYQSGLPAGAFDL